MVAFIILQIYGMCVRCYTIVIHHDSVSPQHTVAYIIYVLQCIIGRQMVVSGGYILKYIAKRYFCLFSWVHCTTEASVDGSSNLDNEVLYI